MHTSTFGNDDELTNELPPNWTLVRFQDECRSMLKEYFTGQSLEEAIRRVEELLSVCPGEADELGVVAIRSALDRDQNAQQAVVELLCRLRKASLLEASAFVRSFEKLFCTWEDIAIDAPKAPEALLAILMTCFAGDACGLSLLTKIPENLMTAGISSSDPRLAPHVDRLRGLASELKEFKGHVSKTLEEYWVSLNADEVASRLEEIGMHNYHHEFVKKAIVTAFSQSDPTKGRDSLSTLLQNLVAADALSKDDLQWGVTRLLGQLDDLGLDVPRIEELTVELLTGLVADELVSAPFLRRCRLLRIGGGTGLRVLDLVQRRSPEFFKKHMGTAQFKKEIKEMIQEYFNSGDQAEFGRCVSDMAPLADERSAELVRKIMTMAMERSGADCEKALRLLIWLSRNEEISDEAIELGFDDLYRHMPDIKLDVPDAEDMARSFVVEAQNAKVLRGEWPEPIEQ